MLCVWDNALCSRKRSKWKMCTKIHTFFCFANIFLHFCCCCCCCYFRFALSRCSMLTKKRHHHVYGSHVVIMHTYTCVCLSFVKGRSSKIYESKEISVCINKCYSWWRWQLMLMIEHCCLNAIKTTFDRHTVTLFTCSQWKQERKLCYFFFFKYW